MRTTPAFSAVLPPLLALSLRARLGSPFHDMHPHTSAIPGPPPVKESSVRTADILPLVYYALTSLTSSFLTSQYYPFESQQSSRGRTLCIFNTCDNSTDIYNGPSSQSSLDSPSSSAFPSKITDTHNSATSTSSSEAVSNTATSSFSTSNSNTSSSEFIHMISCTTIISTVS